MRRFHHSKKSDWERADDLSPEGAALRASSFQGGLDWRWVLRQRMVWGKWVRRAAGWAMVLVALCRAMRGMSPNLEEAVEMSVSVLIGAVGCALLARDLRDFLMKGVERGLDWLFSTGEATPPLDYRLAVLLEKNGKFEGALREYLKLAHYYPKEARAYGEALRMSLQLGDLSAARRVFRRGMSRLENAEDREALRQRWVAASLASLED